MKLFSIALIFLLAGCSSSEDTASKSDKTGGDVSRESVFDPMLESLDKAREVEDVVMQQKQQMDEALLRMEGAVDDPEE